MYKVTVTTDGTTATASKHCNTLEEAEQVKAKLYTLLKMPVTIEIRPIGSPQ